MRSRGGPGGKRDDLLAESDTEVGAEMANYTTIKNFLDTSKPSRHSPEEIRKYYDEEKIIVTGVSAPTPFLDFLGKMLFVWLPAYRLVY